MRKIAVIGDTGAGKTLFARVLSSKLGLPHYDGDAYRFDHGRKRPDEEFLANLRTITGQDQWIFDSAHTLAVPLLLERADTVFYFRFSARVLLYRVLKRACNRMLTGETYADGRPEDLQHLFGKQGWVTTFYARLKEKRSKYDKMLQKVHRDQMALTTFHNSEQVRSFLSSL